MQGDNFHDVELFHRKFGLPVPDSGTPRMITDEEYQFRTNFMLEEFEEYKDCWFEDDLPGMADALIDLVYVAMGTMHMHQIEWQPLWDAVQRANMGKERATEASQSKRGSTLDVIKPEGWLPPDIEQLLRDQGWKHADD